MRRRAFLGDAIRVIEVDGRTLAPATVGHRVARDGVKPGEEGLALPAVAVDVRERASEHLAREVLGVAGLAHAIEDVAVHRVHVRVVQLAEGVTVPAAGAVDDIGDRRELRIQRKDVDFDGADVDECHYVSAPYPDLVVRKPYRRHPVAPSLQWYQNRPT